MPPGNAPGGGSSGGVVVPGRADIDRKDVVAVSFLAVAPATTGVFWSRASQAATRPRRRP